MKQYKVAIIGNGMICNAAHIPAYQAMGCLLYTSRCV